MQKSWDSVLCTLVPAHAQNQFKCNQIVVYLFLSSSIKPGSVLLLTFWPAVEDDDKKVRVTLWVPFDSRQNNALFHFTGILS